MQTINAGDITRQQPLSLGVIQFGRHPILNVTQTENVNTIPRSVFINSSFFGSLRMEEIILRTPHH